MKKNNLDIYFSDICTLNCSYCCANHSFDNENIVNSLEDGSFIQHIKDALDDTIISITLWGLEPTCNGKYFRKFIQEILDYSPYIKFINFSTNGQKDTIWSDFIYPLLLYTKSHQRKLKLFIQFSLDGPKSINDRHRGIGSYDQTITTILSIFKAHSFLKAKQYLQIAISFKATFEAIDWYSDPNEWYNWRDGFIHLIYNRFENSKINFNFMRQVYPTFQQPYNYTKQDGEAFARWNIPLRGDRIKQCGSKSIDYQGNLYDCHLLKNKDENNQITRSFFDNILNELIQQGEVQTNVFQDRLFNLISSLYCWGVNDLTYLASYLRLLGNGAKIKGGKYNMTTVVFNNDTNRAFMVESFSRNTNFENGVMSSYAYMSVIPDDTAIADISYYGLHEITSMKLYDEDDKLIYTLTDVSGHVNSIDESLDQTHMNINANIRFSIE